jgi:hypothetical protein
MRADMVRAPRRAAGETGRAILSAGGAIVKGDGRFSCRSATDPIIVRRRAAPSTVEIGMRGWREMVIVMAALLALPAEAGHWHGARPQATFGYSYGYPMGFYGAYYSPWYYGPRFGVGIHVGDRYPVRRVRSERVDAREQRALKLYVYPAAGQSESQTAEDRYQCHVWAADRSGHDPTLGAGSRDDAESYTRAFTACMEGRNYVVK